MKNSPFLNKLIGFFEWKTGKYQFRIKVISDNPKPEKIKSDIIYVVGGKDYVKWAYLKCPDNCGEIIMLNLSAKRKPSWIVKQDSKGKATINPSINKSDGCRSHFWIKEGLIRWV